ncbi:hypothetical protein KIN20_004380 [Parelaphostrongylus tenuis]|uniref:Uncharacterized protein n=1 Tax=Parelaphostrongylus tenuis TaxID=148309 RepID=A0AAD5QGU6_PARTN|nr:hypothetical protein KIN20_004380 [Parelaphostrongylus tenuis]
MTTPERIYMDVVDGFDVTADTVTLVDHVKREIISRLATSPALLTLSDVDDRWKGLCAAELSRFLRRRLVIDVANFFRDGNPFLQKYVTSKEKCDPLSFHDDIKRLAQMLRRFDKYIMDLGEGKTNSAELGNTVVCIIN